MADDLYLDLVKRLEAAACWRIGGGKDSHEKWRSPNTGRSFIVPCSKSRHTANEVLKQAA